MVVSILGFRMSLLSDMVWLELLRAKQLERPIETSLMTHITHMKAVKFEHKVLPNLSYPVS